MVAEDINKALHAVFVLRTIPTTGSVTLSVQQACKCDYTCYSFCS